MIRGFRSRTGSSPPPGASSAPNTAITNTTLAHPGTWVKHTTPTRKHYAAICPLMLESSPQDWPTQPGTKPTMDKRGHRVPVRAKKDTVPNKSNPHQQRAAAIHGGGDGAITAPLQCTMALCDYPHKRRHTEQATKDSSAVRVNAHTMNRQSAGH